MAVSGKNRANRLRQILVACQYEQCLGNPHPEGALRQRQRFTAPGGELADVSAMGRQGDDRFGRDGIGFGQAGLEHLADQHWLVLPPAEQGTEVRAVMPGQIRVTECLAAEFRPC